MINKKKVHYIRVSTLQQNSDRQKEGILMGAFKYEDKCSGGVAFRDREEGSKLYKEVEEGLISEVHVHSIDRLGRDTVDILDTIKFFTSYGVNLISKKEGLRTLNNDNSENITAKLIVGIMSTLAEFERQQIKERQAEGIAKAKEKGVYKNRTKSGGRKGLSDEDYIKKYRKTVIKELQNGNSVRRTAIYCNVSTATVHKVKTIAKKKGLI